MKQRLVTAGLMLVLFSGVCIVENTAVRERPAEAQSGGVSSVYALAGEFRTVFANLLWIKADHYHHEFIEHNPKWTQNKDLAGLLNLVTTLDPHFVEAYSSGALIYADGYGDNDKAVRYLREGITHNPKAWDLHRSLAILYARRIDDPERALPYARLAAKYCDDDWYRPRMHRLARTIEEMALEKKATQGAR